MACKLVYESRYYTVEYCPEENKVIIYYDDGEKSFEAELQKDEDKLVSTGQMSFKGAQIWSWYDEGDMNGLFWARVFDNFPGVPQVLQKVFDKTPISFEDFKNMLLNDINGIVYHVTGDNSTWEIYDTGIFSNVESYEREFIEDNCPEYLDTFDNVVVSWLGSNEIESEVMKRVGELVRRDIMKVDSVFDLDEILVFDWDSEYVAEAEKVFSERLWEELRRHGVEC